MHSNVCSRTFREDGRNVQFKLNATFTCSNSTIKTLEKGLKYVQS